jgi:hypothetical protein
VIAALSLSAISGINRLLTGEIGTESTANTLTYDAQIFCKCPEPVSWLGIVIATGRHPPPPRVAGPAEARLTMKRQLRLICVRRDIEEGQGDRCSRAAD